MSAREVTAVAGAAVALLTAHGADPETAERYAARLIDPAQAEELLEDCRAQARADVRAELDDLREQVEEAHRREEAQQEELAALRPQHRPQALLVAEAYPGELEALRRHVRAVLDLCDREQRNAMRWENPIPAPGWVAPVQRAALGDDQRADARDGGGLRG